VSEPTPASYIDAADPLQRAGLPPEPPNHVPTHGRPSPLRLLRKHRKRRATRAGDYSRVFVIGSSRTGTSSMGVALMELGFRYTGWHPRLVEALRRGDLAPVDAVVREYEAFKDPPWNVGDFYEVLDSRYPRSKFINTVRDSASWSSSFSRVFDAHDLGPLVAQYQKRNAEIRAYFAGRPDDFLELDVCGGEGWEKLTPFLHFTPRSGSLRNTDKESFRRTWTRRRAA
jgi:hypothetical protein